MNFHNIKKSIYFICILSAIIIIIVTCTKNIKQHYQLSQFIDPETCGGCHSSIYEEWQQSMHNLSHNDPLYQKAAAFMLKDLTDPDEIKEGESCVKCHTPIGVVSGYPKKVSDDQTKVPEIARQGIQCDYCHSATGAYKDYNNGILLDPGKGAADPGVKRGPFKDSESDFHKSAFSEFHTSSQICGTCHDVRHVVFGTKLETTYEEWQNSPYNDSDPEKKVPCQGCHMYQRPGIPATGSTKRPKNPGEAAFGGPKREHLFTHYFVGGNSYIPAQFKDKTKAKMAEERLKNAATLSIDGSAAEKGTITISVKNTGAGHYLPTGLTDTRQMWLEITVKNKTGKIIYRSGKTDSNGYITDGTIMYNTVFGDGKGNPVNNVSKAREILSDKRIPPMQSLKETISLPKGERKELLVSVRLLYRSASQKIVDLIMGKGNMQLPIVTMAVAEKNIKR